MNRFIEQITQLWNKHTKGFAIFFAVMFVLCAILNGGDTDADEKATQMLHYCEMTDLWLNSDLPNDKRPGWPAFKGREFCE